MGETDAVMARGRGRGSASKESMTSRMVSPVMPWESKTVRNSVPISGLASGAVEGATAASGAIDDPQALSALSVALAPAAVATLRTNAHLSMG